MYTPSIYTTWVHTSKHLTTSLGRDVRRTGVYRLPYRGSSRFGRMGRQSISSNWKSLLPLIKKQAKTGSSAQTATGAENPIWFDVDDQSLRLSEEQKKHAQKTGPTSVCDLFPDSHASHKDDAVKYVALDCEMVGIGPDGVDSMLARVSIVNFHGQPLLDTFVKPVSKVTDYRFAITGIRPEDLTDAPSFNTVQKQVWDLIQGKILVGHALKNDFKSLLLEHPRRMIRDTSKYRPFRKIAKGKSPSLRRLAKEFLGIEIQSGHHNSVEDARVAMLLYRRQKAAWENYLFRNEERTLKLRRRLRAKEKRLKSGQETFLEN